MTAEPVQMTAGYRPLSEADRCARSERSQGEPILDCGSSGSTPYIDYQSIDVLLSLQNPRTDAPAELTFYVMGQVKELVFKLLVTEVNRTRDLLYEDRFDEALRTLRRIERVQRVLESTWEALGTITASEFNEFRDHLGEASGLQSYMYRQLEFCLGNKSPRLATAHLGVPGVAEQVELALRSPSLWDAAIAFLHRTPGRSVHLPAECLERDFATPYQPHPQVEAAWAEVYRAPGEHPKLYALGEALGEVSYRFGLWRTTHLLVVERILGNKPGSGGTTGVPWLRRSAEHRFFPELWSAKSLL
ncbi:tryptophan 2,3-dioxygenase [Streptomyces sp. NPDC003233]